MPAVLVIDHNRASLAVARAFHGLGFDVIMGVDGYCDYANLSRFNSKTVAFPDLVTQPDGVFARISQLCSEFPELTGIVCVNEGGTRLLARRRNEIPRQLTVFGASPQNVLDVYNKDAAATLAESLGIPVAPRIVVDTVEALRMAGREIGAPLVCEPACKKDPVLG